MSKYFLDLLTLKTEMNYRGYSEATKKSYIQIVGNFLEVTDKEIIDITKEDVVRYLDENMKLLKKNSRAVHLNALEFFFEEVLGLDITVSIKNYKREFLEKTFMTLEQFNILSNSVTEKERLIYEIIKETGFKLKDIVNLNSQLESIDGNNLFLSIVAASGGTNYAITDMKSEQMWREEFRDFGLISPKRTGKIFITASKENVVNVRESYGTDSSIIHKLANNVAVEEISNEEGWKYVYFYNKEGGYYMKGYIHKSQLK